MQKWYSSYFKILKIVQAMNDETSKKIYSLAFHQLTQYGIGFTNESGELVIQDGMDIFKDISINQQPFEIADDTNVHFKKLQNIDVGGMGNDFVELFPNSQLSTSNKDKDYDEQGGYFEEVSNIGNFDNSFLEEVDKREEIAESTSSFSVQNNPFVKPSFEPPVENPFDGNEGGLDEISPFEQITENSVLKNIQDESVIKDVELEVLPKDLPSIDMPLMLKAKDFTFDIHTVKSKDLIEQAAFIIAPLRLDIPVYTAVVQAKINGGTYISTTDEEGHLEFESNRCRYILDCRIENGKFVSEITLKNCNIQEFDIDRRSFGDKGHIVLPDQETGINVHIIPVSFKSNVYGFADFIYCVDAGDGDFFVESNHGESSALVEINKETYEIVAKWQDKVLYAKIDTPAE